MIKIFTAGGTIDKIYFDAKSEFQVGDPQIVSLLEEANVSFQYQLESILRKDSLEMNDDDRQLIFDKISSEPNDKILVTHGTDTMVATAQKLSSIQGKTIVLVGSMQPARLRVSDAVFNIGFAIGSLLQLGPGVYIAMNGRIMNPSKTQKNIEKNRFEEIDPVG